MYLDFKGISDKDVENYERTLDLNTAIAGVEYDNGDTHYTRENFVSYPDNVLVTLSLIHILDHWLSGDGSSVDGDQLLSISENIHKKTFLK